MAPPTSATKDARALTPETIAQIDGWWRAANYLSVGQIYLLANPLLREPLVREHVKPRLLGHFGTAPGLNLIYAHMNRAIRERDIEAIYITGPGHGGPALVANAYLEGRYSEVYPDITEDEEGMRLLFRQFSFPGGIPSHVAPETPGSIHEGGELGYSLAHAYGAVLPILHLNGYKIANPTVLARIPEHELDSMLEGHGWRPINVTGGFDDEPIAAVHERFAAALDDALDDIDAIQSAACGSRNGKGRAAWPMLVLRSPKGWTGPRELDGLPVENSWRSHQVPIARPRDTKEHLKALEDWMQSYRPEELFDQGGTLRPDLAALSPTGTRRMSAIPQANGGELLRELTIPDFRRYAVEVPSPGTKTSEPMRVLGELIRDVTAKNDDRFRVFGPDETASNRLGAVFEVSNRVWEGEILPTDDHLATEGRVMEVLSEHLCQGWLEGYLLTGRHGVFNCYEAFIHIIDSMMNQHAKWLKVTRDIPRRRPIASLNYLLSSHVWRQDHNGFSHQDPGLSTTSSTRRPRSSASTCRPTPTACSRSATTASAAATT